MTHLPVTSSTRLLVAWVQGWLRIVPSPRRARNFSSKYTSRCGKSHRRRKFQLPVLWAAIIPAATPNLQFSRLDSAIWCADRQAMLHLTGENTMTSSMPAFFDRQIIKLADFLAQHLFRFRVNNIYKPYSPQQSRDPIRIKMRSPLS